MKRRQFLRGAVGVAAAVYAGSATATPPTQETAEDRDREYASAELDHLGREAKAIFLDLCRNDVNAFCEYVLQDEETGRHVVQAPFHVEMHAELDEHKFLVIKSAPETGKTQQMGIGRALWEMGRNPRIRIGILGNDQKSAVKLLTSIKGYIEKSERLHEVFPGLRKGPIWQDHQIVVDRDVFSKDPTIQAVGYHGSIQGSRIDLWIVDDLLDFENTRTEVQRQQLSKWFRGTPLGRLTRGGRVIFLTNCWHPRDLGEELVKEYAWRCFAIPARRPDGSIMWPVEQGGKWDEARLAEKRQKLGELEFARLFELRPRDDADTIFKEWAIKKCTDRGRGRILVRSIEPPPDRCVVVIGVDLGGKRRSGGESTIAPLLFHPNADRQLLGIEGGRWSGGELIRRICSAGERYGGIVAVESNGLQIHLTDLARETGLTCVPIVPFMTGKNKIDPRFGVISLAAEWEAGRWIIPEAGGDAEMARRRETLLSEIRDFVPEQHTGDHLMAVWIAREVGRVIWARLYGPDSEGGAGARVIG